MRERNLNRLFVERMLQSSQKLAPDNRLLQSDGLYAATNYYCGICPLVYPRDIEVIENLRAQ